MIIQHYNIVLLILGLAFLAASVLPRLLKSTPVSLPMIYVSVGLLLPVLLPDSPRIDPLLNGNLAERLSELAVIISLMGVGLKLDRLPGWHSWRSTWRLLAVTMPLCIVALTAGGIYFLGLPLAAAVLLGAVIAPTDPVLASGVQVGPPGEGDENEVRFALTSEAGLNDGLAFPFVNLAIILAASGLAQEGLWHWFTFDLIWKITAGIVVGAIIGHLCAVLIFRFAATDPVTDGFVAIALTLVVYGITELAKGYGFIGVFVAAVMFRRFERNHDYHKTLHSFSEQMEQLFLAALLILFGLSISHGLFSVLTWPGIILGLVLLLVIRPVTGLLGLLGSGIKFKSRIKIGWFGIRGIGTFYYLAHGLNRMNLSETQARTIWAVSGFIILASILLHGITASYIMKRKP